MGQIDVPGWRVVQEISIALSAPGRISPDVVSTVDRSELRREVSDWHMVSEGSIERH